MATVSGTRTFAELWERALKLANVLTALNVPPDAVVGCLFSLMDPGAIELLMEMRLATIEHGAALAGIPIELLDLGFPDAVARLEPAAITFDGSFLPSRTKAVLSRFPDALHLEVRDRNGVSSRLVESSPAREVGHAIDPGTPMALGFTSGTTGPPKPVAATHRAAAWSCERMARLIATQSPDPERQLYVGVPVFAAGGAMALAALAAGKPVRIPEAFSAGELLHLIDFGLVDAAFLTPSMLIDLLDAPQLGELDISGLKALVYGSAIMPTPKLEEAVRTLGPVLVQGYGMSEVWPPVTLLGARDHGTREQPASAEVLSSAGWPVEGVAVKVCGPEGEELGVYQAGEILVQSPAMMRPMQAAGAFAARAPEDWWNSGDLGYKDGDGRLHILCRRADLITREGTLIYPRLIEEAFHLHPAVKEACAVQSPVSGEVVVAVSLRSRMRATGRRERLVAELEDILARFPWETRPDRVMVLDGDLPRSFLGKVLHREIRDRLAREGAERRKGAAAAAGPGDGGA